MAVDQTEGSWTREQLLTVGLVAIGGTGEGLEGEEESLGVPPVWVLVLWVVVQRLHLAHQWKVRELYCLVVGAPLGGGAVRHEGAPLLLLR